MPSSSPSPARRMNGWYGPSSAPEEAGGRGELPGSAWLHRASPAAAGRLSLKQTEEPSSLGGRPCRLTGPLAVLPALAARLARDAGEDRLDVRTTPRPSGFAALPTASGL